MRDLYSGILGIFADAQETAEFAGADEKTVAPRRAWRRARDAERRQRLTDMIASGRKIHAFGTVQIPPIAVSIVACKRCGNSVEFRLGCSHPVAHRCLPWPTAYRA